LLVAAEGLFERLDAWAITALDVGFFEGFFCTVWIGFEDHLELYYCIVQGRDFLRLIKICAVYL